MDYFCIGINNSGYHIMIKGDGLLLIIDKLNMNDELTETEKNVAIFLISLGPDMAGKSTRWIANQTYTSPTTIVRLCKKIGFSGFEEFKVQYLKEFSYIEQQYGKVNANFPFEKTDSMMNVANKVASLHQDTIEDTLSILMHDDLAKAKKLIIHAKTIYIYSFGTALNQAQSFKEKMMKIGKRVVIASNLNYQLYESSCMMTGDLAIIISYSGETENVLKITDICGEINIPILAITSLGENTLSRQSKGVLYISTKENLFQNIADYSIHVSVSLLLDVLYSLVFQENFDENYQHKLKFTRVLENKRKSTNSLLMETDIDNGTV